MTDPAICTFPGCDRPTNPRVTGTRTTYCRRHYDQWRRGEELTPLRPFGAYSSLQVCTVPGCGRKHRAKGLCSGHHRMMMAGQPLRPIRATTGRPPAQKPPPTQEAPPKRKSRLPKGWDRVTPPTPAPRAWGMKTIGDIGPVFPATTTQQAAALHVLRLMCPDDAALLADCLGIETAA